MKIMIPIGLLVIGLATGGVAQDGAITGAQKSLSFKETEQLIAQLDTLKQSQWEKLEGREVAVSSDPRIECLIDITIENNEQYLLVPSPTDQWNTSPTRWDDVDFRGHLDKTEYTHSGMTYMQLCYSLNGGELIPVVDSNIIGLSGELLLAPSDWDGGGFVDNNTGRIRVKIIKIAAQIVVSQAAEEQAADDTDSFSIIVLPDTQYYSKSFPSIFMAQTEWIANHVDALNIKYVLHLGDVTEHNKISEWNVATSAMSVLDGVVPYAIAPGNHDYGTPGGVPAGNRNTYFNNSSTNTPVCFGPGTPYASQPSVGGFYPDEPNQTDNSWHTFRAKGEDYLILALEWGPRDFIVDWANTIVTNHPGHHVILITHAYMYYDDTRYDWAAKGAAQHWNPHAYGTASSPGGTNDGEELWQKLVKKYPRVILTINGHVLGDGTGRLTSTGDHGNSVHQILNNYQLSLERQSGYLRIYTFKSDKKTLDIKTYSPVLNRYKRDAANQFSLEFSPALGRVERPSSMMITIVKKRLNFSDEIEVEHVL